MRKLTPTAVAIALAKGLMPLLVKPRNNEQGTPQDKLKLHPQLLSHVSAYIAMLIMPGGLIMLPVIAWWLDRRRCAAPRTQ